jgi:hypothetical protein
MKTKFQIQDLTVFLTIASTTLYIVFRNVPIYLGTFAFLYAPVTLFILILIKPRAFITGPMKTVMLYGIIVICILQNTLWRFMSPWNADNVNWEFYNLVIMTVILSYYIRTRAYYKIALISKWTVIFIFITLVTTNIALFFNSELVRQSASTAFFSPLQAKLYQYSGAFSYSYAQALICLIPILFFCIKQNAQTIFSKKFLGTVLVLIIVTEIRSQVFANILVTMIITVLSSLSIKSHRKSFVIILLIGVVLISIPNSAYSDMFFSISKLVTPGSELENKLKDFSSYIDNPDIDNETGARVRVERFPMLLETFLNNPFTGFASEKSSTNIDGGAHLYFMNKLALYGIFGFSFFVFMMFRIFKSIMSLFEPTYKFYYLLSILSFVFLGAMKAVGGREVWLVLIVTIPGISYWPLMLKQNGNSSNDSTS